MFNRSAFFSFIHFFIIISFNLKYKDEDLHINCGVLSFNRNHEYIVQNRHNLL